MSVDRMLGKGDWNSLGGYPVLRPTSPDFQGSLMNPGRLFFLLMIAFLLAPAGIAVDLTLTPPASNQSLADPALRAQARQLTADMEGVRSQEALARLVSSASDIVEGLVMQADFDIAQKLYESKLQGARRLYGEHSGIVLDALQDGIFIATQRGDNGQVQHLLSEYASVAAAMRGRNLDDEIELAQNERRRRLQTKLDRSVSTIFQPLSL
jgi:hypothetical protein